jgi:hypothetical protein
VTLRWRLLDDGPGAGDWNMALDQALLQALAAHADVAQLVLSLPKEPPPAVDRARAALQREVQLPI